MLLDKNDEPCYLVIDNAGSHGTSDAIVEYKNMLLTQFNIHIIFQMLQSHYTNALNLGVWMLLQFIVERKHFLSHITTPALTNTVMETWESTNLDQVLLNVFG